MWPQLFRVQNGYHNIHFVHADAQNNWGSYDDQFMMKIDELHTGLLHWYIKYTKIRVYSMLRKFVLLNFTDYLWFSNFPNYSGKFRLLRSIPFFTRTLNLSSSLISFSSSGRQFHDRDYSTVYDSPNLWQYTLGSFGSSLPPERNAWLLLTLRFSWLNDLRCAEGGRFFYLLETIVCIHYAIVRYLACLLYHILYRGSYFVELVNFLVIAVCWLHKKKSPWSINGRMLLLYKVGVSFCPTIFLTFFNRYALCFIIFMCLW